MTCSALFAAAICFSLADTLPPAIVEPIQDVLAPDPDHAQDKVQEARKAEWEQMIADRAEKRKKRKWEERQFRRQLIMAHEFENNRALRGPVGKPRPYDVPPPPPVFIFIVVPPPQMAPRQPQGSHNPYLTYQEMGTGRFQSMSTLEKAVFLQDLAIANRR